eukprot:3847430-Amphidinium_carterae.1
MSFAFGTCNQTDRFLTSDNRFAGALPDIGLHTLRALWWFDIVSNRFSGTLPDTGISSMTRMQLFCASQNSFTGMLPDSGINAMGKDLQDFYVFENRFTGMVPESGICAMMGVRHFMISDNCFTGALPDDGFGRKLHAVNTMYNRLAGTLPAAMRSGTGFDLFAVGHNGFQGPKSEH